MPSRRIAAALLAGAISLGWSGCGGDIRADELSRSIDTLISSAGEGQLLAEGVAEDRTKTTFVRVRARELGDVVEHESEKLSDASATRDLAAEKRAAVTLADRISSELGDLQVGPTDEASAGQEAQAFSRLATRGKSLQGSL